MLLQQLSQSSRSSQRQLHSVSRFIARRESHFSKRTTNKLKLVQAQSRRTFSIVPKPECEWNHCKIKTTRFRPNNKKKPTTGIIVEDRWVGKNGKLYRLHGLNESNLEDVVNLHNRIFENELNDPNDLHKRDSEYFLRFLKGDVLHDDGGHMCGIYHKNELVAYSTLGRPQQDSDEMQALFRAIPVTSSNKDDTAPPLIATFGGTVVCKKHRGNGFQSIMTDYRKDVAANTGIYHFMSIIYDRNAASLSSILKHSLQVCAIAPDAVDASVNNFVLYNALPTSPGINLSTPSLTVHGDEEIKIDLGNIDGHRAALEQGLVGWKLATGSKKNGRRTCLVYSTQAALQAAQEYESFMQEQTA